MCLSCDNLAQGPARDSVLVCDALDLHCCPLLLPLHAGNILVRRVGEGRFERRHVNPVFRVDEAVQLIPIDHGFSLPETLESAYFEWLHWPQVGPTCRRPTEGPLSGLVCFSTLDCKIQCLADLALDSGPPSCAVLSAGITSIF